MTNSAGLLGSIIASAIEAESGAEPSAASAASNGTRASPTLANRLDPHRLAAACASLLAGKESYRSFLYLQRVGPRDVEALFAVTRSPDTKERWAKLWVVSRFLAKLSRDPLARPLIVDCLRTDMPALHLLSKFTERANTAARRFFERLHDPLLALVIPQLWASVKEARRAKLLAAIVASIERSAEPLREAITAHAGAAAVTTLLPLLTVDAPQPERDGASTSTLGERLGGRLCSISSSPNREGDS